jgi:hypothetical protein
VVLNDMVLVDELVTGITMLILKLLLGVEVVETTEELETGMMVSRVELVRMAEGVVTEEIALEVVEVIDESVTDRTRLELDALTDLDVEEIIDEFEIGYKTLLERTLLLDPDNGTVLVVLMSAELVDRPWLVIVSEERLVDAEDPADVEGPVDEKSVTAEGIVDTDKLIDAEEFPDVEGPTDGLDTAGLKTTVAKMTPEASLRLCVSN